MATIAVVGDPEPRSRTRAAAEPLLEPVPVELGATAPTRGLYLLDSAWDDPGALERWPAAARPQVAAARTAPPRWRPHPPPWRVGRVGRVSPAAHPWGVPVR